MRIDYEARLLEISLEEEIGGASPSDLKPAIARCVSGQSSENRREVTSEDLAGFGSLGAPEVEVSRPRPRVLLWSGGVAASLAGLALLFALSRSTPVGPDGAIERASTDESSEGPHLEVSPIGAESPKISGRAQLVAASMREERGLCVPEVAVLREFSGRTVLESGWVYAEEESAEIYAGLAQVTFLGGGSGIVKSGEIPNVYEAAAMVRLLKESDCVTSEEELNMLFDPKSWMKGIGWVLCLFVGEALVNETPVAAAEKVTLDRVFERFDADGSGSLERAECICECSGNADFDKDGAVTRREFEKAVVQLCGSTAKFESLVKQKGGVDEFYRYVSSAKRIPKPSGTAVTLDAVFDCYDANRNAILEKSEQTCHGTKCADLDESGTVTRDEFRRVVTKFFGEESDFLRVVHEYGGARAFHDAAVSGQFGKDLSKAGGDIKAVVPTAITIDAVFNCYDRDRSGILEAGERCCAGTKLADANDDTVVTKAEFSRVIDELFGSQEKFIGMVRGYGSASAFYEAVAKKGEHPHGLRPEKMSR